MFCKIKQQQQLRNLGCISNNVLTLLKVNFQVQVEALGHLTGSGRKPDIIKSTKCMN